MESNETTDAALRRAAARAEMGGADLVATLVGHWRRAFPDQEPADAIEGDADMLSRVALCRRPRTERWIEDVHSIARTCGSDSDRLIGFLRTAEAVEGLSASSPAEAVRLLAARDREDDPN